MTSWLGHSYDTLSIAWQSVPPDVTQWPDGDGHHKLIVSQTGQVFVQNPFV